MKGSILPLAVDDVRYRVGGAELIRGIGFVLSESRRTVILGPNGAGKSLLLRLCHGLIAPTSGSIRWSAADAARRQAMVFQRAVVLRRSVAANVGYALSVRGVPRAERRRRIAAALELAGLSAFAETPARVLSGGEQQRLALARAWALRPEVLFLDEPTANLDPAATRAVEGLIDTIHDGGCCIVLTTHDLAQARRLADDVLFLHCGRLLERAAAADFFAGPASPEATAFMAGELLW